MHINTSEFVLINRSDKHLVSLNRITTELNNTVMRTKEMIANSQEDLDCKTNCPCSTKGNV